MSDSIEGFANFLPDETLAIAIAYANRQAETTSQIEAIHAELTGAEHVPTPIETLRDAQMGRTVLLMARVSDPSMPVSLAESLRATADMRKLNEQATEMSDADLDLYVSGQDLLNIQSQGMDLIAEKSGYTTERSTELFARDLTAIREIAEEKGVSPVDVIEDDDLSNLSTARSMDLNEFSEIVRSVINAVSADSLTPIVGQILDTIMPPDIRAEISEDELAELRTEIEDSMRNDPEFSQVIEGHQESARQYMIMKASQVWGTAAVRETMFIDDSLMPRKPLANIVVNALLDN